MNTLIIDVEQFFIPYRNGDRWGFRNKSKHIVIACIYEDARTFSEGLVAVKHNGKWGFISTLGDVIIPFIYSKVRSFSGGFAYVYYDAGYGPNSKDSKYVFIDKIGKEIIYNSDDCIHFSEDIFTVCNNWHFPNTWQFYDKSGKLLFKNEFVMDNYPFPLEAGTKGYASAGSFSEGLAAICDGEKWGFIDMDGKKIIQNKYDEINSFADGLAAIKLNDKWGFSDKSGKEVIPCIYKNVCSFSEGLAAVCIDDKWGFIDTTGKEVIPFIYEEVDLLRDVRDHREGCIEGNWLYSNFGGYLPVYSFSEGLTAVKCHNNWRFIDKTGKEIISCIYEDVKSFSEGLAAVKHNGKWGFIDKTGKEIISCIYDYPDGYSGYDFLDSYSKGLFFLEGIANVRYNGYDSNTHEFIDKRGFIDKSGNEFWED